MRERRGPLASTCSSAVEKRAAARRPCSNLRASGHGLRSGLWPPLNPAERSTTASRGASWPGRGRNERRSGGAAERSAWEAATKSSTSSGEGLLCNEEAKEREERAQRSSTPCAKRSFSPRTVSLERETSADREEGSGDTEAALRRLSVSASRGGSTLQR